MQKHIPVAVTREALVMRERDPPNLQGNSGLKLVRIPTVADSHEHSSQPSALSIQPVRILDGLNAGR